MARRALLFCLAALASPAGITACKSKNSGARVRDAEAPPEEGDDPYQATIEALANLQSDITSDDATSSAEAELALAAAATPAIGLALDETKSQDPLDEANAQMQKLKQKAEEEADQAKRRSALEKAAAEKAEKELKVKQAAQAALAALEAKKDSVCVIGEQTRGCRCEARGIKAYMLMPGRQAAILSQEASSLDVKYPDLSLSPLLAKQIAAQTCQMALDSFQGDPTGTIASCRCSTVDKDELDRNVPTQVRTEWRGDAPGYNNTPPGRSVSVPHYYPSNLPIVRVACFQRYKMFAGPAGYVENRKHLTHYFYGASTAFVTGHMDTETKFVEDKSPGLDSAFKHWKQVDGTATFKKLSELGCASLSDDPKFRYYQDPPKPRWLRECEAEADGIAGNGWQKRCVGAAPLNVVSTEENPPVQGCTCAIFDNAYEAGLIARRAADLAEIEDVRKQFDAANKETAAALQSVDKFQSARQDVETQLRALGSSPAEIAGLADSLSYKELKARLSKLDREFTAVRLNSTNYALGDRTQLNQIATQYTLRSRPFFSTQAAADGGSLPLWIVPPLTDLGRIAGFRDPLQIIDDRGVDQRALPDNFAVWPYATTGATTATTPTYKDVVGSYRGYPWVWPANSLSKVIVYVAQNRSYQVFTDQSAIGNPSPNLIASDLFQRPNLDYQTKTHSGNALGIYRADGCGDLPFVDPRRYPCQGDIDGKKVSGFWTCSLRGQFKGYICGARYDEQINGAAVPSYAAFSCLNVTVQGLAPPATACSEEAAKIELSHINPFHPSLQSEASGPSDERPGFMKRQDHVAEASPDTEATPADCRCATGDPLTASRPSNTPPINCGQYPLADRRNFYNNGWRCDKKLSQFVCLGRKSVPFVCGK